jgi:hypothetical protein
MQRSTNKRLWYWGARWSLVLSLTLALDGGCLVAASGATDSRDSSVATPARAVPQRIRQSRLGQRVSALANALDLDATQQAQLTKVLEWRREQVRKVWNDPSVPPDYRVAVAHAIGDRTAEQIRGLLNEEQKRQYKLPRQPHPAADGEGQRSVEDWMNAMKPR